MDWRPMVAKFSSSKERREAPLAGRSLPTKLWDVSGIYFLLIPEYFELGAGARFHVG